MKLWVQSSTFLWDKMNNVLLLILYYSKWWLFQSNICKFKNFLYKEANLKDLYKEAKYLYNVHK